MIIPEKISEYSFKIRHKLSGISKNFLLKTFLRNSDGKKERYFVEKHCDSVQIFALDLDRKIIGIKQYRPAKEEVVFELPGGTLEEDESPFLAAERELNEETGYKTGKLFYIGKLEYSVGSIGKKHLFIATECQKNGIGQRLDDTERIIVSLQELDTFKEMLRNQKVYGTDLGYLALDKLGLL
jgi:ADP-ribose pyrophosphatase